jgi:hypothetical protein
MNNLQKIIATGALIGLSILGGCKDKEKTEMDSAREQKIKDAREQKMAEFRCGIIRNDPNLREITLKHAEYITDYNDPVSHKSGKIAVYGDNLTGEWKVSYLPDN